MKTGERIRVVSLVPSWTETLIEAGANVVGRTRFCIHPSERTKDIPAIGGTKSFDLEQLRALKPDLILLDREENTKPFADEAARIASVHASHVLSVQQMPEELRKIAALLWKATSDQSVAGVLEGYASRFEAVLRKPVPALHNDSFCGLLEWKTNPKSLESTKLVYVIWQNPWMAVTASTFIASMLEQVGFDPKNLWPNSADKYPKFNFEDVPSDAVMLLSSEPYPFAKLKELPFSQAAALVDGESFSWFGLRALKFLEASR